MIKVKIRKENIKKKQFHAAPKKQSDWFHAVPTA